MNANIRLCDLKIGHKAYIKNILNECALKRRLLDIGMVENSLIECVGKSPCGDPSAYLVCGAVIALRKNDCEKIMVENI